MRCVTSRQARHWKSNGSHVVCRLGATCKAMKVSWLRLRLLSVQKCIISTTSTCCCAVWQRALWHFVVCWKQLLRVGGGWSLIFPRFFTVATLASIPKSQISPKLATLLCRIIKTVESRQTCGDTPPRPRPQRSNLMNYFWEKREMSPEIWGSVDFSPKKEGWLVAVLFCLGFRQISTWILVWYH
jgi:hypothetical protein